MRTVIFIALAVIALNSKAQQTSNSDLGPHGGMMKSIQNYRIEMLHAYKHINVYLYDKELKVVPNKGIMGSVLLFYPENVNMNVKLILEENEGFSGDLPNLDYLYCIASFNIYGKTISAKFLNQTQLALKEKKEKK